MDFTCGNDVTISRSLSAPAGTSVVRVWFLVKRELGDPDNLLVLFNELTPVATDGGVVSDAATGDGIGAVTILLDRVQSARLEQPHWFEIRVEYATGAIETQYRGVIRGKKGLYVPPSEADTPSSIVVHVA